MIREAVRSDTMIIPDMTTVPKLPGRNSSNSLIEIKTNGKTQ